MNDPVGYQNNPLHGLSLKNLLTDIVNHYGFEILFAYLNINCFKSNPSIESSIKFLKKTDWAREKVENFYLYQFKSLPKASDAQFQLPPRERIVPADQVPGLPAELSLEDAERLREKRSRKAASHGQHRGNNFNAGGRTSSHKENKWSSPYSAAPVASDDPWSKWRK